MKKKAKIALVVIAILVILIAVWIGIYHPFHIKQPPMPFHPIPFRPIPYHPCIPWHGLWSR